MTIHEAIHKVTAALVEARRDAPQLSAHLLAAAVLQCTKLCTITEGHKAIKAVQWDALQALAARRVSGEPMAYILGYKEFYGRNFMVNKYVLIPRPETEDVMEAALTALTASMHRTGRAEEDIFFVDVGTGSGCIAVSIAAQRQAFRGILLDISPEALQVAMHNVHSHGLAERLFSVRADLCHLPLAAGSVDLLISNPPYVSAREYTCLEQDVRDFEPKSALVPTQEHDCQGMYHLECVARQAWRVLRQGGVCVVEHGAGQGQAVQQCFIKKGLWDVVEIGKDLAGLDRFCLCCKK